MTITAAVVASMDLVFAPVMGLPPIVSITIFSAILSTITLALNKLLMKKGFVKEMKEKMKALQATMKQAQKSGDKELMNGSMKEMMSLNSANMKESMKVMIASMVFGIAFLMYMSAKYATVPVTLPFIGLSINWIYWYIVTSMVMTMAMRKLTGEM